ncbi:hypothetical protein TNCV_2018821 [Trichonephila clavipes]|nr:hypothetical protein TNCV_2018821 [Trichonephila clavipes]
MDQISQDQQGRPKNKRKEEIGRREVYKESKRGRRRLDFEGAVVRPLQRGVKTIVSPRRNRFGGLSRSRLVIHLYLSLRSKADFGIVKIAKKQLHGGFRANELTQTRCGITESECIGLFSSVLIYVIILCERVLYEGILETGGVMGQCVQMWTRNYGALDQTARVCFGVLCANRKKEEVKRDFGPANKKERGACCEHTPGV